MPNWNQDQVKEALKERGWYAAERDIEHGIQFVLNGGTRVNCYTTGRVQIQGRDSPEKQEAISLFGSPTSATVRPASAHTSLASAEQSKTTIPHRVFIVYGHDVEAREQLELLLRRLRLEPIVLQNLPGGGDTIIEKLEELTEADFACVLVTPDDEGRRKADAANGGPMKPRARQNVVLELGMVLARLGRHRVAILLKGKEIERPSDIDGLIYIQFDRHVQEVKNDLAANLQEAGFVIQVKDLK